MDTIQWGEQFSVGNARLDHQHQNLIGIYNQMARHSEADVRSETISDVLTRMMQYAREHFRTEEALLQEHEYPHLDQQQKEHKAFLREVTRMCLETMEGKTHIPNDILTYLRNWWSQHILHCDMKYKEFLLQKQV